MKGKLLQIEDSDTNQVSSKQKSDEVGSVLSQESSSKPQSNSQSITENAPALIQKLLEKPAYISLKNTIIVGSYGHSSAIFKRPIIEGSYFMEFTIKEDGYKQKATSNPSAVRVGVCMKGFDTGYPLGYAESVAYKSSDGRIIR